MAAHTLSPEARAALDLADDSVVPGDVSRAMDLAHLLAPAARGLAQTDAVARVASILHRRTGLAEAAAAALARSALDPSARATVDDAQIRAFAARFGESRGAWLRATLADDLQLTTFATRYGPEDALLLLDALFELHAADGRIVDAELSALQDAARQLGIDQSLVGALFRKHDPRHAAGALAFPLSGDDMIIGRAAGVGVRLPDPQVAARHARLHRSSQGWRVQDLGSGRPTVLDGNPVQDAPLRPGSTLHIGPYALTVSPDGTSLTAIGAEAASSLAIRNLRRTIGSTVLLDDVSFTVFSGEVVAVVGPSGAGKTTLLHAIAGMSPFDSGEVLLDGEPFLDLLEADRSLVGVVPQDDVVHGELTVRESLRASARLRLPADTPIDALDAEVDRVLDELGIDHIQDVRIGDAVHRGISGGQRKRVNLGQELLSRSTKVLFLDEPTSGLDPQTTQDILTLVRQLADQQRIVFIVTHDLTPAVLSQVDHLIVLAPGGRLAWFGPPADAARWFDVASVDALFGRLPSRTPEAWRESYAASPASRKYVATRDQLVRLGGLGIRAPISPGARPSAWLQLRTLVARTARVKLRDRGGLLVSMSQAPILGLAMMVVFPRADTGALFMLALSALWFGASGSIRELIAERAVWRREARIGVGVLPYLLSKVLVLGLLTVVQCVLLAAIVHVWLDMGPGEGDQALGFSLPALAGITALTGLVGASLGLMLSAAFRSSEAAVSSLPIVLIPQITFGGLLVKLKHMPVLAKFISSLMITRFAFDGMLKTGDRLWVPTVGFQERRPTPLVGVLSDLGFRSTGSPIDDLGLTLIAISLILSAFFLAFLTVAGWLTYREGHKPR